MSLLRGGNDVDDGRLSLLSLSEMCLLSSAPTRTSDTRWVIRYLCSDSIVLWTVCQCASAPVENLIRRRLVLSRTRCSSAHWLVISCSLEKCSSCRLPEMESETTHMR